MYPLDPRFASFLVVATLLIVTPGPDTALVIRNVLIAGRRAASCTAWGIGAGSIVWGVSSVLGVAILIEGSAFAFTVFKLVGAGYLIYLGMRSLLASLHVGMRAPSTLPEPSLSASTPRIDCRTAFRQGLLSNLLNPKAGAIFVTALPQFIRPGDPALRLVAMMVAYEAILVIWLKLYGHLINRARQSLIGSRLQQVMHHVTGMVLIGLGVRLATE